MLARALGLYEISKTKAVIKFLKTGATFIDIGANKGEFSLLAAKIVGKEGNVLAFEPEPNNCYWLKKSIKLNTYQNIRLYELALSDADGISKLYLGEKSGWHTLLANQPQRNKGIITINIRTLDSILEESNYRSINIIKIDVEGAELKVLHGAYKTLLNNNDIILLLDIHPTLGVKPKEVFNFLTDLGLSIYQMRPPFNIPIQAENNITEIIAYR